MAQGLNQAFQPAQRTFDPVAMEVFSNRSDPLRVVQVY